MRPSTFSASRSRVQGRACSIAQRPAALHRLLEVIQAAMGWENYHLHVFDDGRAQYGTPDPGLGFHDESEARLCDLVTEGGRLG
ncbi:MAG: IS1096 element passenger TnpR family protein [Streptosporangiaceae bacterium]